MKAGIRLVLLSVALTASGHARAGDASVDFTQSCANCHTIGGGRLTGPDLKGVTQRRSRDWLIRLISDPKQMKSSGDPAFLELFTEYGNVMMVSPADMTTARAEALLSLIDEESAKPKSRFVGSTLIDRPLTAADARHGEDLFLGKTPLKNGGPSCLSCHDAGGVGGLGGGRLGPDLTLAFARLGGEQSLAAWLAAPASPVMRPVYGDRALDPAEILPLVAYLRETARANSPTGGASRLAFLVIGLLGVTALFSLFDLQARRRLKSVRRSLQPVVPHRDAGPPHVGDTNRTRTGGRR